MLQHQSSRSKYLSLASLTPSSSTFISAGRINDMRIRYFDYSIQASSSSSLKISSFSSLLTKITTPTLRDSLVYINNIEQGKINDLGEQDLLRLNNVNKFNFDLYSLNLNDILILRKDLFSNVCYNIQYIQKQLRLQQNISKPKLSSYRNTLSYCLPKLNSCFVLIAFLCLLLTFSIKVCFVFTAKGKF